MGRRYYWVCACGRWTWTSKSACIGCAAAPPPWVLAARASGRQEKDDAPCNEAGDNPTESLPLDAWVSQPKGKRAQAKARAKAKSTADADQAVPGIKPQDDPEIAEAMVINDDGPSLADRLDVARKKVSMLEGLSSAVRACFPGYDLALATARDECEQLQRDRRAARPVQWRLVEAKSNAIGKAASVSQLEAKLSSLRDEHDKLVSSIAATSADLEAAREAQILADESVAAIHAELPGQSSAASAPPDVAIAEAVQAAEGLEVQVGALPAAVASGNAGDSIHAIQRQLNAVLSLLRGGSFQTSPPQYDVNVAPAVDATMPQRTVVSARHGTSPARSSGSSSISSGRSRTSRRCRSAPASEILPGQQVLEEVGIHVRARSDPFLVDDSPAGG